jgi:hypothetical protein
LATLIGCALWSTDRQLAITPAYPTFEQNHKPGVGS